MLIHLLIKILSSLLLSFPDIQKIIQKRFDLIEQHGHRYLDEDLNRLDEEKFSQGRVGPEAVAVKGLFPRSGIVIDQSLEPELIYVSICTFPSLCDNHFSHVLLAAVGK